MEIHTVSCRVVQHRWEAPCSIAAALLEAPGKKATKIRKHINGLQTPIDLTSSVITARARARAFTREHVRCDAAFTCQAEHVCGGADGMVDGLGGEVLGTLAASGVGTGGYMVPNTRYSRDI